MAKSTKYNKTIKFLLPKLPVDKLNECLKKSPPSFLHQQASFYSLFWDLVHQLAKVDDGDLAPLHSKILQDKYGKYKKYREYLVDQNIIIHNPQYEVGDHSMTYGFHPDLLSRKVVQVEIDIYSHAGRYIINRRNKQINRAKKFDKYINALRQKFNSVQFDYEKAFKFIEGADKLTHYQYISAMDSINRFKDDNKKLRYFKRNKTNNRIDNNLSSLPSYLKQFINSYDILVQLDLKNSQPVLCNSLFHFIYQSISSSKSSNNKSLEGTLCYKNNNIKDAISLINKEIKKNSKWVPLFKNELDKYKYYTSGGVWYEHLADVYNSYYNTTKYKRKLMKPKWMAIAYSSNRSIDYREDKKPFEKAYPYISKVIRFLKKKDYKQFSITLQRIESHIFIDLIVPELIKAGITPLTVHDCMIIAQNEQKETHQIMLRVLKQELGFEPEIEDLLLTDDEMTKVKPPRRIKKLSKPAIEAVAPSVQNEETEAVQEPEISFSEVMNSFIESDRSYFMKEINNSSSLYKQLASENDAKVLTKIFIENDIISLGGVFWNYYEEYIESMAA